MLSHVYSHPYKIKIMLNGEITKYKRGLEASGFLQIPSMSFNEIFAPYITVEAISIIVAISTYRCYFINRLNVTMRFA